jgi:hypothetical protein
MHFGGQDDVFPFDTEMLEEIPGDPFAFSL